jgi:hypothetical protein
VFAQSLAFFSLAARPHRALFLLLTSVAVAQSGCTKNDTQGSNGSNNDGTDTDESESDEGDSSAASSEDSSTDKSDASDSADDSEGTSDGDTDHESDEESDGSSSQSDDSADESSSEDGDETSEASDESESGENSDSDTTTPSDECQWKPLKAYEDHVEPSSMPPGGLAVENVPMFIAIGWDDNGFVDGMDWALDYYQTKRNPKGNGNPCTFDDLPARATFYITSQFALEEQWRRAYEEGHEIGNHTNSHDMTLQQNGDKNVWLGEMSTCNSYLHDTVGVPADAIVGFRTPFLSHSEQTYEAIVETGFFYDCSIEHYKELATDAFIWPYTLDNGRHANSTFNTTPNGKYAGLWEMPVYQILLDEGGNNAITGFDYNMWAQSKLSKEQALSAFKVTLAQRMKSNRAPLLIGAHTDYYSADNDDANNASTGASYQERREAIEEFIDFALNEYPEVRVVSYLDVLHWMREPVGLDGKRGR